MPPTHHDLGQFLRGGVNAHILLKLSLRRLVLRRPVTTRFFLRHDYLTLSLSALTKASARKFTNLPAKPT